MYFSRKEFACKCGCGFDTFDYETYLLLLDVRTHFGERVFINSACRCVEHNSRIGGSENSMHLLGRAADFWVENTHEDIIADYLEKKYPNTYGIGRYSGRTHVDSRLTKARWDMR